ncbi:MAG: potassium channel family protein [Tateyamaria sp.]|uniref:potassium channel family protein n=1 Tax=Tateyamaria sp. TaxID=1929288 RepID=UPI00328595B4
MTTTLQILLGSALLTFCALVHVGIVASAIPVLEKVGQRVAHASHSLGSMIVLSTGVLIILLAHTMQVWTWAIAFIVSAAIPDFPTSFYFSMVTYTTLGYGDLVLGEGLRIFATFAAVTGLLTFGISTAFLISILTSLFPEIYTRR